MQNLALDRKIPKRLRGRVTALIEKMQKLHSRCSYHELLRHYCPIGVSSKALYNDSSNSLHQLIDGMEWSEFITSRLIPRKRRQQLSSASSRTQKIEDENSASNLPVLRKSNLVDAANPVSQVSAFCQAVISKLLPREAWGLGTDGERNREIVLKNVDVFVSLRRFESLSLHTVSQRLKVIQRSN